MSAIGSPAAGGVSNTARENRIWGARRFPRYGSPVLLPSLFTLSMLTAWQIYVTVGNIPPALLPSPLSISRAIGDYYPLLLRHAWPTTLETAGGFLISSILGVSTAVTMSYSRSWREALYPNLVLLQVIPKIALAPLFILWLGLGSESRLAFSVFISIFPVVVSTYTGFTRVDPNLIRLCRSFRAPEWRIFFSVRLPSALPFIFSGMKVSVTMSMIGVVIGEFITAQEGLGYLIMSASARADTVLAMAAVVVLCISGLLLFGAVATVQNLCDRRFGGGESAGVVQ